MVHWKHTLNLKDIFALYKSEEITLVELGNKIADRIENSYFYSDYEHELENIVDEFRGLECDDVVEYFDMIFASLYDWGDGAEPDAIKTSGLVKSKTCWIETK